MHSPGRFADRADAGTRLGAALCDRGIDADIVLAVPRGGLPVGRAVADRLGVPLDIVVAQKVGLPGNPEYAIAAVASDGSVWRDEAAIRQMAVDPAYVERECAVAAAAARRKADRYRRGRPAPDLRDKTVVVVDDGVATGSTVRACLRLLDGSGAERVVLAVPVGPPETVTELRRDADEVLCLDVPRHFASVGQCYDRFDQVSDEEAMAFLDANA
jgi:hypothetical protein